MLIVLATLGAPVRAAEVWVITDARHPVTAPPGTRLIELDAPARIEAQLAAGLPADAARASQLVRQRLREGGTHLQRQLAAAHQDVVDAWSLGITKVPAVVVDRRHVIYGEADVQRALARIAEHRGRQP